MADPHQNHQHYNASDSEKNPENPPDDFALEAAIGDAFLQFGFLAKSKEDAPEVTHPETDFETAVDNAFKSLQEQPEFLSKPNYDGYNQSDNGHSSTVESADTHTHSGPAGSEDHYGAGKIREEKVFESEKAHEALYRDTGYNAYSEFNGAKEHYEDYAKENHGYSQEHQESEHKEDSGEKAELDLAAIHAFNMAQSDKESEDDRLQSAIGEAFRSLREFSEQPEEAVSAETKVTEQHELSEADDNTLREAISSSISKISERPETAETVQATQEASAEIENEDPLDLAGIVQNVVQQVAGGHNEDVHKAIPHLDENVLAHFQLEADKDDEKFEDSTLKDAIATAVKSAMLGRTEEEEHDQDLEKLQMNEILQNAFSMAMQSGLELSSHATERRQSVSTAIAELAKKSQNRQETHLNLAGQASVPKSLSIAETLALHRSSMDAPRKDYSAIQTLEDSVKSDKARPAMSPQLSSVLSSLSQHIHSGNQTDLMLVIRQMTTALMLNKASTSSSTAQDLLQQARSHPDEQKFLIQTFLETHSFLVSRDSKGVALIEKVLGLFDVHDMPSGQFPMMNFYESALATLSSFNSARLRTILTKPEVDYSEYKEKIRTDNRERKKKWRELNAERNKDNDLRSRVAKRAHSMFGEGQTEEKKAWIEEEFNRRREKRLAKGRKDDEKQPKNEAVEAKASASFADDQVLVKRVADVFSLVAATGLEADPQATLEAAAAATAVAASVHGRMVGVSDSRLIQTSLTRILNNLLETAVRSGSFLRIPFLSNVYQSYSRPTQASDNKELMDKLKSSLNATGSQSALEMLQDSRKRLGLEFQTSELKRPQATAVEKQQKSPEAPRLAGPASGSNELMGQISTEVSSLIETQLSEISNQISEASHTHSHLSGSLVSGLRMPVYKKPSPPRTIGVKTEEKAPLLLANRVNSPAPGLRKPPAFQRPTYSKGKGGSLGFPKLFSPSFKQ